MSSARLTQKTLDDKFPRLLDSLGEEGNGDFSLGRSKNFRKGAGKGVYVAPILCNKQPVGNVLVKCSKGQADIMRATISEDVLPSIQSQEDKNSPYKDKKFINLLYIKEKRVDGYSIDFP